MANRYWIANYTATPTFSTAANWNTNPDGTGSSGAPAANDTVHFGYSETLNAGLGYGSCELSGATVDLSQVITYSGYNKVEMTGKFAITAASRQFAISPVGALDPSQAGFKVGMVVTVTGCADAANNDTYQIATLSAGIMTMTTAAGGSSMANEVAGNDVTITYDPAIDLKGQMLNLNSASGSLLTLDSKIKNTTGSGGITIENVLLGGAGNRYVKLGDNHVFENRDDITLNLNNNSGGTIYFDDGVYPTVNIKSGTFTCDYISPTSNVHGKVQFNKFKEDSTSPPTWTSGTGSKRSNTKKIFQLDNITSFALFTTAFNTGQSTWIFDIHDANLQIPVTGDYINYPSGFVARWYNLSFINSGTNTSRKAILPARRNLDVNSLSVGVGANLEGEKVQSATGTVHKGASTITSNTRPTINGSWNFVQIADGVYSSLLHESFINTPSHGTRGHIQFSYDGGAFHSHSNMFVVLDNWVNDWSTSNAYISLIDGTYISSGSYHFNQQYPVGGGIGANTIWISNGTPSVPYFTDSAGTEHSLIGGGGGGGGMTSWTLSGDSGANQTITDGNTVDIEGGTGINTVGTATDKVVINCDLEGTELKSTGETGGTKFLREDGDGTCSWQTVSGGGGITGITVRDEGVALSTLATGLDFVGAGVVASGTGVTKTITIAGGGGASEVVEYVNSNTTINIATTIAVCASTTACTAKVAAGVGTQWVGMSGLDDGSAAGGYIHNYDFTATNSVIGTAMTGLIDVPPPTVGKKLSIVIPFPTDGSTMPQGVTQITCTGQSNAFIGHDLIGMKNTDVGRATNGSHLILPENYLFMIGSALGARFGGRRIGLGHHVITLVGAPAPTGDEGNLPFFDATFSDILPNAYWWVDTNNELLYDGRDANDFLSLFNGSFRATVFGQYYIVC